VRLAPGGLQMLDLPPQMLDAGANRVALHSPWQWLAYGFASAIYARRLRG